MTVLRLEAWCDYVTEEEYLEGLSIGRSQVSSGPGEPPGGQDESSVGWAVFDLDRASAEERQEILQQFRSSATFQVHEFAVLADGRRLLLHDPGRGDRGFRCQARTVGVAAPLDPWMSLTLEDLEASVLSTVLPDDDSEGDHPWEWLAQRVRDLGGETTAAELEQVAYEVVFSERLRARIAARS